MALNPSMGSDPMEVQIGRTTRFVFVLCTN